MAGSKKGHNKGHPPFNKNGEGGRPRKWDGKCLDELAESLDSWIEDAVKYKKEFWWWDWCYDVGLNQDKVSLLAKRHDRFRQSYEAAKAWQESIVARYAITKKFSEGFSKFMLVNHYADKWKEKSTIQEVSPGVKEVLDNIESRKDKIISHDISPSEHPG